MWKIVKKILSWILGLTFIAAFACGICLLVFSQAMSLVLGIVVICLSLATGLILPNPISLFALIAGISMIFAPVPTGIVLACVGAIGMLANGLYWVGKKKPDKSE